VLKEFNINIGAELVNKVELLASQVGLFLSCVRNKCLAERLSLRRLLNLAISHSAELFGYLEQLVIRQSLVHLFDEERLVVNRCTFWVACEWLRHRGWREILRRLELWLSLIVTDLKGLICKFFSVHLGHCFGSRFFVGVFHVCQSVEL